MFLLVSVLLLAGVCIGGWRYGKQRRCFQYDKLDAEMEALRCKIEQRRD